jgi:hypothetical protein
MFNKVGVGAKKGLPSSYFFLISRCCLYINRKDTTYFYICKVKITKVLIFRFFCTTSILPMVRGLFFFCTFAPVFQNNIRKVVRLHIFNPEHDVALAAHRQPSRHTCLSPVTPRPWLRAGFVGHNPATGAHR